VNSWVIFCKDKVFILGVALRALRRSVRYIFFVFETKKDAAAIANAAASNRQHIPTMDQNRGLDQNDTEYASYNQEFE
jgi:hypothetical protein